MYHNFHNKTQRIQTHCAVVNSKEHKTFIQCLLSACFSFPHHCPHKLFWDGHMSVNTSGSHKNLGKHVIENNEHFTFTPCVAFITQTCTPDLKMWGQFCWMSKSVLLNVKISFVECQNQFCWMLKSVLLNVKISFVEC